MAEKTFYRKDIQGLRGLAVVLVIIYHLKFSIFDKTFLPGGLFGVDIFFVLSGFVIATIINNGLQNKSFSFSEFYIKRFRRILPALLFVVIFFLFFFKFLLPSDLINYAKSILTLLFANANYYFYFTNSIYGEQNTLLKLLIHTWSLCVEFQFYILFPLFYVFCIRYFKKYLNIILLISIVLNFALTIWITHKSPSFSFYISISRAWEFLAGVYIVNLKFNEKKYNFLPLVGVSMIFYSIFFFSDKISNPGFFNILPVLGCVLIILFSKNYFSRDNFFNKIFFFLGNISYSLYLWHYPILALSRYTDFLSENETLKKFILVLIIFFLSLVSYKFIEQIFRNKKFISDRLFKLILFFIYLLLILISYLIIEKSGFPDRLKTNKRLYSALYLSEFSELIDDNGKPCFYRQDNFCVFNKDGSNGKIFFIGDSHLRNIFLALKDDLVKSDYEITLMLNPDCWYAPDFHLVYSTNKKSPGLCTAEFQNNVRNILTNEKNSTFVFGGRLPRYLSNKPFDNHEGGVEDGSWPFTFYSMNNKIKISQKIKSSINELSLYNKIILIYPIPEAGWHVTRKFFNNSNFTNRETDIFNNTSGTVSYPEFKIRSKESIKLLDEIRGKNIFRIYPHKITCDIINNRCLLYDLSNIYYLDSSHPSLFYSKLIASGFKDIISRINSN